MELYKLLEEDVKTALKNKDSLKVSVIRMVLSAVKMIEIDKKLVRAQDKDVLQVIRRHIKQHRDSIEQFEKGNRQDLADKEKQELVVLESYAPEEMGEAELQDIVKEAISLTGAVTKQEAGKVMKAVMEKAKDRCDGNTVKQAVLKLLK